MEVPIATRWENLARHARGDSNETTLIIRSENCEAGPRVICGGGFEILPAEERWSRNLNKWLGNLKTVTNCEVSRAEGESPSHSLVAPAKAQTATGCEPNERLVTTSKRYSAAVHITPNELSNAWYELDIFNLHNEIVSFRSVYFTNFYAPNLSSLFKPDVLHIILMFS